MIFHKGDAKYWIQEYQLGKVNSMHMIFGLTFAALGAFSIYQYEIWPAPWGRLLIGIIVLYIGINIFVALYHRGRESLIGLILPGRLYDLVLLILLFSALVFSFSNLYIHDKTICKGDAHSRNCLESEGVPTTSAYYPDKTRIDAIRFSVMAMTAWSVGDYSATAPSSQNLVIWQRISAIFLVILAYALVISRISS